MQANHPISLLMFGTFGIVILIIAVAFVYHMRKRSNRHPMDGQPERNIEEIRRDGPNT